MSPTPAAPSPTRLGSSKCTQAILAAWVIIGSHQFCPVSLHKRLFDNCRIKHPNHDLHYLFYFRVALGHYITCTATKQSANVWAIPNNYKELKTIAGSQPPVSHHALVFNSPGYRYICRVVSCRLIATGELRV